MNIPTPIAGPNCRGAFFLPKAFHQSLRQFVLMLPIAFACAAATPSAFAGAAVTQNHSLGFTIADSNGQNIATQDLSGLVSYDPATGALNTVAPGTELSGNWSWSTTNFNDANNPLTTPVLSWHTDAKNADGSWVSVVQLKATGNVDPFMSYSFSAKNNTGAAQTYSFSYGESIVPPVAGNYSLYSDVAGSLTHGTISPSAAISPVLGDFDGDGISEIQTLKLSTDGGATFFNAGVDVGTGQTRTASGTTIFGPISDTITGNLPLVDYWQFDVSFSLTPGKDAAALSGYAEISLIPEPSAYAGLMGAAVLIGAAVRRRLSLAV